MRVQSLLICCKVFLLLGGQNLVQHVCASERESRKIISSSESHHSNQQSSPVIIHTPKGLLVGA